MIARTRFRPAPRSSPRTPGYIQRLIREHGGCRLPLSEPELARIEDQFTAQHVPKGASLLEPPEVCRFAALVVRGCLRVYFTEDDGSERVLYFATEGWWITDFQGILLDRPSGIGIDAIEPTELLCIDTARLSAVQAELPEAVHLFAWLSARSLMMLQGRLAGSLRKTAAERYRTFQALHPGLDARLPQYQIAAYLGVSPEFLSRLRRRRHH